MNIIVYVDCENIHQDYADQVFEKISKTGKIISCNGYADFSKPIHSGWKEYLLKYNARAIQVFHNTKDAADAEIIIDMTVDAITKSGIDALCIVSKDGIYGSLGRIIHECGKTFIGIGGKPRSTVLDNACDIYINLVNMMNGTEITREQTPEEKIDAAIETLGGGCVRCSSVGIELSSKGFNIRDYGHCKLMELIDSLGCYKITQDEYNELDKYIERKCN